MTKLVMHKNLRNRLKWAEMDGSKIAADINAQLEQYDQVEDLFKGHKNYFTLINDDSSPHVVGRVSIRYSTLNPNNAVAAERLASDPVCVYKTKDTVEAAESTFITLFKNLPHYTMEEMDEFVDCMRTPFPILVRMGDTYEDVLHAYRAQDYSPVISAQRCEGSLHNSCMRHEWTAQAAASFYIYICRCKIIIAEDLCGRVVGRAIVWPGVKVVCGDPLCGDTEYVFMDRIYHSSPQVRRSIVRFAKENGVDFCRARQEAVSHPNEFRLLNDKYPYLRDESSASNTARLAIKYVVHPNAYYEHGVPYVDTLSVMSVDPESYEVSLRNTSESCESDEELCRESLRATSGSISSSNRICASCGSYVTSSRTTGPLCKSCAARMSGYNPLDRIGKVERVHTERFGSLPSYAVENGVPKKYVEASIVYNSLK